MKVNFLVEEKGYGEDMTHLIEAIKKQGHGLAVSNYKPFENGEYNQFPDDACVTFFGSLNLARQLSRTKRWVPGPFCNLQNYKCSTYYAYWKHLWNDPFLFMPFRSVEKGWLDIVDMIDGWENKKKGRWAFFIRPDDGFKSFTGQLVSDINHESELRYLSSRCKPETLCLISRCNPPDQEFRFFCRRNEILTGCQYRKGHGIEACIDPFVSLDVVEFARSVIDKATWFPESLFVMDVGVRLFNQAKRYGVIELNSFSCSGMYACDVDKIIEAAAEVAEEEYKEVY